MSDNVKMNQKFELWRSKKQKVVSAVINKNQPVYTAIKALNSKELPSVLQNKNIRTSTPWRDLLRMSLALENTKMKVDTNDEDDSILLVENNFVKRFAGPHKIEIKKPMTKAKEWFGKKFLELTNSLPQIHSDHSGGINTESYKVINDMAAEQRRLSLVEKNMSELRIRIPTIQICVRDEYDGLYS